MRPNHAGVDRLAKAQALWGWLSRWGLGRLVALPMALLLFPKTVRYLGWKQSWRLYRGSLSPGQVFEIKDPRLGNQPITLRARSSDFFVYQQVFVWEEYRHLAEPDAVRTIVDAGAYIGLSSLYFAAMFPQARILALEPDPDNFRHLRQNCQHEPRIIPIQAALWSEDGVVELWNKKDDAWAIRVREVQSAADVVPARSLLSLMRGWGIETFDLIKLDIEGAEAAVCADPDASEWLARTRLLVIELHAHLVPGSDQSFWRLMEGQPFELKVQGENLVFRRRGAITVAPAHDRSA